MHDIFQIKLGINFQFDIQFLFPLNSRLRHREETSRFSFKLLYLAEYRALYSTATARRKSDEWYTYDMQISSELNFPFT